MKNIYYIVFFALLIIRSYAQQTDYTQGTFILNEDWFGHNNSSINFINNNSEIFYRVYENENQNNDLSLGCTSQYGTIYGDKLLVMSKQTKDDGDSRTGGRFIIANATSLKNIIAFENIEENEKGKSIADSRACIGVNENIAYLGTSNGIFIYNFSTNKIVAKIKGTENPLITGNENNTSGQGSLYRNQIGTMLRSAEHVFAVYQDSGILVINPKNHEIEHVIKGCYSSIVQSKDGYIWAAHNTNPDAQHYPYGGSNYGSWGDGWEGNELVRINPFTFKTKSISIPDNIPGIKQTWYAWTAGGFCASANSNCLYWTDDNGWFESSKIYKYDIDKNNFELFFDVKNIHEDRKIYGAGIGIHPETDHVFVFLFNDFSDNSNWIGELDNKGEVVKIHELIANYWFPATTIFPDNHPPIINNSFPSDITVDKNNFKLYLGNMITDNDNLDASIVKTIINNSDNNIVSAYIKNDTLNILRKSPHFGGKSIINLNFNSNGKTVFKNLSVNIPSHLFVKNAIPDINAIMDQDDISINISNVFYYPEINNNAIQFNIESNNNNKLLTTSIHDQFLNLSFAKAQYGNAEIIIKASLNGEIQYDTFTVKVDAPPILLNPVNDINVLTNAPEKIIDLSNIFTDPDNNDDLINFSVKSTNTSLLNTEINNKKLIINFNKNQQGKSDIIIEANSKGQIATDTFTVIVKATSQSVIVAQAIENIYVLKNASDSIINLTEVFANSNDDNNLIEIGLFSNSNKSLLTASVSEKKLKLSFTENKTGEAEIIVTGTFNRYVAKDTINIFVKDVNQNLYIINPIQDLITTKNAENLNIDLSSVFTDPDDNDTYIQFSVLNNTNPELISTFINEKHLELSIATNQTGFAKIVIKGSLNNYSTTDTFTITVNDPVYHANPISDIKVQKNSEALNIDLSSVFNDPDDDNNLIQLSIVSNSSSMLVHSEIKKSILSLSFTPDKTGTSEIILQAQLGIYTAMDTFIVRVDNPIYVVNPISDITVLENTISKTIDLSSVFNDPDADNNNIIFQINKNTSTYLVNTIIDGNILTLNFTANKYGKSELVLKGSSDGFSTTDTFIVTIDKPLFIANPIEDIYINENSNDKSIELDDVFFDPDNSMNNIQFAILSNNNTELVKTSIKNKLLTLSFAKESYGVSEIIIKGTLNYHTALDTFKVDISNMNSISTNMSKSAKIYPNPANNCVYLESPFAMKKITLLNLSGSIIKRFDLPSGIFEHSIHINDLQKGFYLILIEGTDTNTTIKLVKK